MEEGKGVGCWVGVKGMRGGGWGGAGKGCWEGLKGCGKERVGTQGTEVKV